MPEPVVISAAVEGLVDGAVVRKLIACVGGQAGSVYGKNGKPALKKQINGFNNAARRKPWVVLVDLNSDADCAPPMRESWLPEPAPLLCFRIAVRQVEAWLMADADTLAPYLGVARSAIPRDPETLANAKTEMEACVHPVARRFKDLGAAPGAEVPLIRPVGTTPRVLTAPVLVSDPQQTQQAESEDTPPPSEDGEPPDE